IAYWLTHSQFWTIAVFAVEVYMLTALTGSTVGKRLLGIRVIRVNGGPAGFRRSLGRPASLLTVIPPLLTDRDPCGMHGRAAATVVVRMERRLGLRRPDLSAGGPALAGLRGLSGPSAG